jgi:Bacterial tandem repeat domain 1
MSRRGRLATILAAVVGMLALGMQPATASPGQPSSVFDPNRVEWRFVSRIGLTSLRTNITQYRTNGYMPVEFDYEPEYGSWGAIFQRNTDGRRWSIEFGMTAQGFASEQLVAAQVNQRLVDVEEYIIVASNGSQERRYVALWIENREHLASSARFDMTQAQMAAYFAEQRDLGRMPVEIQKSNIGPGPGCYITCYGYMAIWVENRENLAWHAGWDLTSEQAAEDFNRYRSGYRTMAIDQQWMITGEFTDAIVRYTDIWVENRNGRGWYEYRNMNLDTFDQRFTQLTNEGYRPVFYDLSYQGGLDVRQVMVWRQNT